MQPLKTPHFPIAPIPEQNFTLGMPSPKAGDALPVSFTAAIISSPATVIHPLHPDEGSAPRVPMPCVKCFIWSSQQPSEVAAVVISVFVGVVTAAKRGWQVMSPEFQRQEGTARAQTRDFPPGIRACAFPLGEPAFPHHGVPPL